MNHDACNRRIVALEADLRAVATHWPGWLTGMCMGCDDAEWPCIYVERVMGPHLAAVDGDDAAALDGGS